MVLKSPPGAAPSACQVLDGVYSFVAQLNEGRATKKRPTEFSIDRVLQARIWRPSVAAHTHSLT